MTHETSRDPEPVHRIIIASGAVIRYSLRSAINPCETSVPNNAEREP
jgi:hypothetical protein